MCSQALSFALKKVSRRAMHSAQLKEALLEANFSEEAFFEVQRELERLGIINDEEYLAHLVQKLKRQGKSERHILAKCRLLGIEEREVSRFFSGDLETLKQLVAKKYPILLQNEAPFIKKQKAMRALFQRGYSPSLISCIINEQ